MKKESVKFNCYNWNNLQQYSVLFTLLVYRIKVQTHFVPLRFKESCVFHSGMTSPRQWISHHIPSPLPLSRSHFPATSFQFPFLISARWQKSITSLRPIPKWKMENRNRSTLHPERIDGKIRLEQYIFFHLGAFQNSIWNIHLWDGLDFLDKLFLWHNQFNRYWRQQELGS